MARVKGLLLWSQDPDAPGLRDLLAEDRELTQAALGAAGELPPGLPPLDQVIVLADWPNVARDPAIVDRWRRGLGTAAVAVIVTVGRDRLGEAARVLEPLAVDDFLETPCHPAHLTRKLRTTFRYLADLQAAQGLRSELVRQVVDFKEFNRVALALSAERDVNRLLELIVSKCREVTTADAGSLYLVEEKDLPPGQWEGETERMLRFVVAQNDSKSLDLKSARLPLNRSSIAGYVALTRTPLNLPDVYRLPANVEYSHSPKMDQALGYRTVSMLVIPMVDHTDEVIGVIQMINKKRSPRIRLETPEAGEAEAQPFGIRDQEMVSSLASLAATALNKALLLSRIERLLEGIVRASVTAIEQRDPATAGHSDRVARLTVGLARVVDRVTTGEYRDVRFSRDELKEMEYAAILHDIGKVGVREHVLVKAKKLFDPEVAVIAARFDFAKRTLQFEYARRMLDVVTRLGPEAARPQVKALEEELERKLGEIDHDLAVVQRLNEPTVVKEEVAAHLRALGEQRYRYFDGSLRPLLTDAELRNLAIPQGSLNPEERAEI